MKISIVIPSNNEANYVDKLTDFIIKNSAPENIEEIIIVEAFNTNQIVKVAEKKHAKLYYNLNSNSLVQMEMGAFEAKGEIIYFIKPNCIPPVGFDKRIIKYVQEKRYMGCFDYEISPRDNFFMKIYKRIFSFIFKDNWQADSFFIMSCLFYQSGGNFKQNKFYKLKSKFI